MNRHSNIIIQEIKSGDISSKNITLSVLRLDLVDPVTGGNKYFKLKYNLQEAKRLGHNTLLTFGGAYSNHIAATAMAGKENNFKTIGVIRGEEPVEMSHTLRQAKANGMKLIFWSREKYRCKNEYENIAELEEELGSFYLLPEGGSNSLAVKGCAEILREVKVDFDIVCVPVGTGGTIAGIIYSLQPSQKAIGFSALKDGTFLKEEVLKLLHSYEGITFNRKEATDKFDIITDFHFGGYAKYNDVLIKFIKDFNQAYGIPLDFVYTGKMMFGLFSLIKQNYFSEDRKILAIHTGGLQGNAGIGLS